MIVALVGVDGSGKTTQARMLAAWLTEQGVHAGYFENPGGRPTVDRWARRAGFRDGRHLLGRGYLVIEASIRWLAISRALWTARRTGRTAVMDRYSYCQYAVMRARSDPGERRVRAAFRRFPQPDLVCMLDLPATVAQHRVRLRGRDREDVSYLAALDAAYRSLPEFASFRLVDARGDADNVQAALRDVVTASSAALADRSSR